MALKPKFLISWIVLSAVFISLSVTSTEQQVNSHSCYWCGPLAEQVHRSQRAPKCSGNRSKIAICDEDLPYCAIVAKSPPYVESRYCVKFYQDECYSLYCNTTKTWKITCPCQGELCNGINTLRENEAFKALNHNVGKVSQNIRFKRTLISNVNFIGLSTSKNKIDNITTDESKDAQNQTTHKNIVTEDANIIKTENIKNEKSTLDVANIIAKSEFTPDSHISVTEAIGTDSEQAKTSENNITATTDSVSNENTENILKTQTTVIESVVTATPDYTPPVDTTKQIINNEESTNLTSTMIEITIESEPGKDIPSANIISGNIETDITVMSSEVPKQINDTTIIALPSQLENVLNLQTTTAATKLVTLNNVTPETTTGINNDYKSTMTEANIDVTKARSSKNLPTADALQHSEIPNMKTEQILNTTKIEMTTQTTIPRNNTAVRMNAHILQYAVVISVIFYY